MKLIILCLVKNRAYYDIVFCLLEQISDGNDFITAISNHCNLTHDSALRYLQPLVVAGFLEEKIPVGNGRKIYRVTYEGRILKHELGIVKSKVDLVRKIALEELSQKYKNQINI